MSDSLEVRIAAQGRLVDRLSAIRKRSQPDSPAIRLALTRAALLISNQAKINVRRKGIVDTGRLLNSIRYEFARGEESTKGLRVLVGSFGIPYAAMHEFGGRYTPRQMRAMFATMRDEGKLSKGGGGKGLLVNGYLQRRPYLRPAFLVHKDRVAQLLADAIEGE